MWERSFCSSSSFLFGLNCWIFVHVAKVWRHLFGNSCKCIFTCDNLNWHDFVPNRCLRFGCRNSTMTSSMSNSLYSFLVGSEIEFAESIFDVKCVHSIRKSVCLSRWVNKIELKLWGIAQSPNANNEKWNNSKFLWPFSVHLKLIYRQMMNVKRPIVDNELSFGFRLFRFWFFFIVSYAHKCERWMRFVWMSLYFIFNVLAFFVCCNKINDRPFRLFIAFYYDFVWFSIVQTASPASQATNIIHHSHSIPNDVILCLSFSRFFSGHKSILVLHKIDEKSNDVINLHDKTWNWTNGFHSLMLSISLQLPFLEIQFSQSGKIFSD